MECDPVSLSVKVYHLEEIGGENGVWLWDLGIVTLVGGENNPTGRIGNMEFFSAVANNFGAESLSDKEPDKTEKITVLMADYTTYVPTSTESSTHAISEDQEPYMILEKDVVMDDNRYVVLKEERFSGRGDKIAVPIENFNGQWDSVMEI